MRKLTTEVVFQVLHLMMQSTKGMPEVSLQGNRVYIFGQLFAQSNEATEILRLCSKQCHKQERAEKTLPTVASKFVMDRYGNDFIKAVVQNSATGRITDFTLMDITIGLAPEESNDVFDQTIEAVAFTQYLKFHVMQAHSNVCFARNVDMRINHGLPIGLSIHQLAGKKVGVFLANDISKVEVLSYVNLKDVAKTRDGRKQPFALDIQVLCEGKKLFIKSNLISCLDTAK